MSNDRRYNNPEEWGDDALGHLLSNGNIQIYRNIGHLLVKVMATNVLVFFRHRFGVNVVNFGSTSWGVIMLAILFMGSSIGNTEYVPGKGVVAATHGSQGLLSTHLSLFILFSIYHMLESRRNLRRMDGKGQRRHGYDLGDSLLAPVIARLLGRTGLIQEGKSGAWYQIRYFTVQKWIEPILIISVGFGFQAFGIAGYGWFLILCGLSVFALAVMQERVYFEQRQRQWDAGANSDTLASHQEKSRPTRGNTIVTPPAPKQPTSVFEQWKHQRSQSPQEE